MAAMSTSLVVFSDSGNSRTYVRTGHTPGQPKLVIQKRKVPAGNAVMAEDTVNVVDGTTDASDAVISQRVTFQATVRRPITGNADDVTAALAVFRDLVASDEFGAMVVGQTYLKNG